jgi:MFS family permease
MASTPRAGHVPHKSPFNVIVVVAALGYFVDIYDLLLFGIVRNDSLRDLGLNDEAVKHVGVMLIDWQMAGLLLGGILWGIIGDVRGRLAVLFGSIITYSIANIANGFVQDVEMYAFLRFIAGIGLAGELGAGVTLVSETMHKDHRGWGTTLVASFGVLGAVVASLVGDLLTWRNAYFVGGGLGIALLVLRFSTYESGMFVHARAEGRRPRLRTLLGHREAITRYLACIGIGIPIWYAVGLLVLLSKELSVAIGLEPAARPAMAIMWAYVGLALGDFTSGYLSQKIGSRKRAVAIFLGLLVVAIALYLSIGGLSPTAFYAACTVVGFAAGYWALFVTIASEQFGTDVRATVTTTVPNFVRGAVIPITLGFLAFEHLFGTIGSVIVVGVICFGIAFVSWLRLGETFGKDLDYVEADAIVGRETRDPRAHPS